MSSDPSKPAETVNSSATLTVDGRTINVRVITSSDMTPNPKNGNLGRPRGNAAIEASLRQTGLVRGIVVSDNGEVIAGNHALTIAEATNVAHAWIEVDVPDGTIGVVTRRSDWKTARDPMAVQAAFNDNRCTELNYDQDPQQLLEDIELLQSVGESFDPACLTDQELQELLGNIADEMIEENNTEDRLVRCPHCGNEFNPFC